MKVIGTKITESDYETFEFVCNECGQSKSELLRDLVKKRINRDSETEEKEPQRITITSID